MEHLLLLLHFISYTTGITAITLGCVFYFKYKKLELKYIIVADLFFTSFLFFDTINLYSNILSFHAAGSLEIIKILGMLFSSIGLIYFFVAAVHKVTGAEFQRNEKELYLVITSIFVLLSSAILYILYYKQLISRSVAFHSGFFLANIILAVGVIYAVVIFIQYKDVIHQRMKRFSKAILVIIGIMVPLSIFLNIIQYWWHFSFPIAFSPIAYLITNIVAIIEALKYYIAAIKEESVIKVNENNSNKSMAEDFFEEYHLTQREQEIIKWVMKGHTNKEIGDMLFISQHTARNHIYNIFKKTGIKNRFELISKLGTDDDNRGES